MRNLRRAALVPAALAATALTLTGCNDESGGTSAPSQTSPAAKSTAQPTSEASKPPESSDPGAESSTSASSGGSAADEKATTVPKSEREDSGDPSSLDAETTSLPKGPVTDLSIKKLGGYERQGGGHGQFYAVLSLDSTEAGILSLQYVMLDKSGKELKTVDDTVDVGGTKNELKITRAGGQLPADGKVAKVRLRITKNATNQFATVTMIDPKITTAVDPKSKVPLVRGRYKTSGKASVTSLTAICSDASGKVVVGNSPVSKIKSPTWTNYEVKLFDAPDGYRPSKCYVGS